MKTFEIKYKEPEEGCPLQSTDITGVWLNGEPITDLLSMVLTVSSDGYPLLQLQRLTSDHVEYHGTLERVKIDGYARVKIRPE